MKTFTRFLISAGVLLCFAAFDVKADISSIAPEQCAVMKKRHVITDNNPVGCDRLAHVQVSYIDFKGKKHSDGQIVVLDIVADHVRALFAELLLYGIPIAMVKPMEYFDGNDEESMAENNTASFNGRAVTGGKNWSKHAYGVAIDVNPLQNPYVSRSLSGNTQQQVLPAQSAGAYLQRRPVRGGMAEEMVAVFYKHGFLVWGGNWKEPVDYQHFEIGSIQFIQSLLAMPPEAAKEAFKQYINSYRQCIAHATDREKQLRRAIHTNCAKQLRK